MSKIEIGSGDRPYPDQFDKVHDKVLDKGRNQRRFYLGCSRI
ncbi:MAG: hypothetical protein O2923_14605 [Verrucomicrobia bacterium]|nr:hypothetical protein [Verrucomicrobiota bacterium]